MLPDYHSIRENYRKSPARLWYDGGPDVNSCAVDLSLTV